MEQIDVLDESNTEPGALTLSPNTITFLTEIRKWANFLAILGFIMTGLMVVFGLFAGTIFNSMSAQMGQAMPMGGFFGIFYILIALVYFFPIFYLYRFASSLKIALNRSDHSSLESAFENLKSHYKLIGILAIIMLAFYAIGLVFGLIAGLAGFAAM